MGKRKSNNKQNGFSLIELLIVIAVISFLSMLFYQFMMRGQKSKDAAALGNQLASFISAVETRTAEDQTLAAGVYNGVLWLQDATCHGISPIAYLPCNFTLNSPIINNPDPQVIINTPVHSRVAAQINIGPIVDYVNGVQAPSPVLASEVVMAIKSKLGSPYHGAFNGTTSYNFDKVNATLTINIIIQQTADVWLRIDGANQMQANVSFNDAQPENKREIVNTSAIRMKNTGIATITNDQGSIQVEPNNKFIVRSSGIENHANTSIESYARNIVSQAIDSFSISARQSTINSSDSISINGTNSTTINSANINLLSNGSSLKVTNNSVDINGVNFTNSSMNIVIGNINSNSNVNIVSKTTNINSQLRADGTYGDAYIGNQTGVPGNSNVYVNDITLRSAANKRITSFLAGYVLKNVYSVYSNSVITKPACPDGGEPKIIVIPQTVGNPSSGAGSKMNVWADNSGASWVVRSSDTYFQGLANVYCAYL
ncbi:MULTISPECIES: prepilin-type N-terminal cleavage/methylation domain-containing protein [Cysteiniphilum]|uniref:Prepilin-type N-terminal cleavage/methylation domain-containing protein n=1 Tax=Cysteiniphilum litorale TaxID=2056700 RepID=A0A8J2Z2X3_9GAMM|nr:MULTISPECIES: prepilin-type N-terminal cleavage/methylation domain-containing protein [Cysteiniphilum]GGF91981.1 hypothetical protein GCM10010995_06430 [Cysteiniphilum litorale]